MFGSYLHTVVCRRAHVLFTLIVLFANSGVQYIHLYCFVFLFCCLRLVYPMLPVSLDCFCFVVFVLCTLCCQFLWIVFVLLSSSCVPYVASFSGFVLFCCLRLVYPMLPVFLDCLCMIAL